VFQFRQLSKSSIAKISSKLVTQNFPKREYSQASWKPPPFTIVLANLQQLQEATSLTLRLAYNDTVKSYLLLLSSWKPSAWARMKEQIKSHQKNVLFYLAFPASNGNGLTWTQIIGLNGVQQIALNTLQFIGKNKPHLFILVLPLLPRVAIV